MSNFKTIVFVIFLVFISNVNAEPSHSTYNGTDQYSFSDDSAFKTLEKTWAFEMKLSETAATNDRVISNGQLEFFLEEDGGEFRFGIFNGVSGNDKTDDTYPVDTWMRIVLVGGEASARLYVDGALAATHAQPAFEPSLGLAIGARNKNGDLVYFFGGSIRNLEIYSGATTTPADWIPRDLTSLEGATLVMQSINGSGLDSGLPFTSNAVVTAGINFTLYDGVTTMKLGESFSYDIIASDDLGSDLDFTLINNPDPDNASISETDEMIWTPILAGDYIFRIGATNAQGEESEMPFEVSVANDPPEFNNGPVTTATINLLYSYTPVASDSLGSDISFSFVGPTPTGMQLVDGVITWVPTIVGNPSIVVRATDSQDEFVDQSYTITVNLADSEDVTLDFNDVAWGSGLGEDLSVLDSEGVEVGFEPVELADVSFVDNSYGGTALHFGVASPINSPIVSSSDYKLSEHLMIETKVKLSDLPENEMFIPMEFSPVDLADLAHSFSFFVRKDSNEDLELVVKVDDLELPASTKLQGWKNKWLHLIVELKSDENGYHVNYFADYAALGSVVSNPVAAWAWTSLFPGSVELKTLQKTYLGETVDVDFVRINHLDQAYNNTTNEESYAGEIFVTENSSVSIVLDGSPVASGEDNFIIKRIINPPSDINSNGTLSEGSVVSYETAEQDSVFHGIFEINFGLVGEDFLGDVLVDIIIERNAIQKRIGTMLVGVEQMDAVSWHQFYWNSRSPLLSSPIDGYDNWSTDDSDVPFRENVKFKFILR